MAGGMNPMVAMMQAMMGGGMMGGGGGGATNVQRKPGDWNCPGCGDHQFARNTECRKCGGPRPAGGGGVMGGKGGGKGAAVKKAGDWFCPACGDLQFAKNDKCRKCEQPNPDPAGSAAAKEAGVAAGTGNFVPALKPGDWNCPSCNDLQFARNSKCRKCNTPNPDPAGCLEAAMATGTFKAEGGKSNNQTKKPGDWHCSSCGDLQFARNSECRKCGAPNMTGGGKGGCGNQAMMQMMNMMGQMMNGGMGGNNMGGNNMMGGNNRMMNGKGKGGGFGGHFVRPLPY